MGVVDCDIFGAEAERCMTLPPPLPLLLLLLLLIILLKLLTAEGNGSD